MIPIVLDYQIRQVLIDAARMTALTDIQKEELILKIVLRLNLQIKSDRLKCAAPPGVNEHRRLLEENTNEKGL